ncbi:putative Lipoamide acyltransferase component of branched-chain alpha-keto acid dehydrogenase complex, mitochondrial [Nannochloris sp. 'desiccata']|nr:putative Lipoamide acyltransferase component of branched-chain alpha-keto acid dehydrogenase complex, mitochondrial [Chlorella desiccata (nom. nud.)]
MLQRGCRSGRRLLGILRARYPLVAQSTLTADPAIYGQPYQNIAVFSRSWEGPNPLTGFSFSNPPSFSSAAASSAGLTNLKEFRLAQTGEGIQECELVRWYVQEGDEIEEFGRVCEVQSDKATIEITSPFSGVIKTLKHAEGDTVPVGGVLAEIAVERSISNPVEESCGTIDLISTSSESDSSNDSIKRTCSTTLENGNPTSQEKGKVVTSPAVRRLAQELNVDILKVFATGPGGRVTKGDVMAYHEAGLEEIPGAADATGEAADAAAEGIEHQIDQQKQKHHKKEEQISEKPLHVIPLRGYRRAMFKTMTTAASIPHFHFCDEVNTNVIIDIRSRLQGSPALKGVKLTYLPFFIKAAALALAENPSINASIASTGDAIIQHAHINIGVAVATPFGLAVPNIKHVEQLSIAEIAREISRLQTAAMNNQLKPEEVSGATFTLSNIGAVGGTYATPLINSPEVAIMALGKIQKVPRFTTTGNGVTVEAANIMNVSFGADHRVVDGATLAGFGVAWKTLIEDPGRLILELR